MTNVSKIFIAATELLKEKSNIEFSRQDIKNHLGLSTREWDLGYTGSFQGMVDNCPPLRNKISPKYRAVFTRIGKGIYTFTNYGLWLIDKD